MVAKVHVSVRSFVAEWTALEARGRAIDWERATLVTRWNKKLGAESVETMLREDVGLGPPRLGKLAAQVKALERVPGRKTWEALGWTWVNRLSGLEDVAEAKRVEASLLKAAELKGGVLQDGPIKDELKRIGVTALLPKARDPNEADAGDVIFRREIERLVRSGLLAVDKIDPYVVRVGRLAELAKSAETVGK